MVEVRKAVAGDIDRVHKLGGEVKASKVNENTVAFCPKRILFKILKDKDDVFLVAEKGVLVVGYIIVGYSSSFEKANIENIFVDKSSRGDGVGTALLEKSIDILKERGCAYVCVFTKIEERETIAWFRKRNISGDEKFFWLDLVLDESFSGDSK